MRLRIISIWVVFVLAGLLPQLAKAQVAASNPLEWAALAEGNELINGQIDKQIKGQTQTALMQNSIAAEFNRIHEWEKQYNSYLKTANGYASSLKACTHLYNDGVRIFLTLGKLMYTPIPRIPLFCLFNLLLLFILFRPRRSRCKADF